MSQATPMGFLHKLYMHIFVFQAIVLVDFLATLIQPCKAHLVTEIFHLQEPLFTTKETPELFK